MHLKTILNYVEKHKSFVCGKTRFCKKWGRQSLLVDVRPRRGSRALCDGCRQCGP
jgi:hypothetical protein